MCNGSAFTYRKLREDLGRNTLDLYSEKNNTLINATYLTPVLSFEVELIEPDHFADVGKMATEKIEELDNYDWQEGDYDYQIEILYRKLNQVIRRINNDKQ